nr:hypothetical protein [uncultured Sphingomonas sp.]
MPRNEGIVPPCARVDIRYRGGVVVRDIDPATRRWTINDPDFGGAKGSAFDIASWQPAGSTGRGQ